MDNSIFAKMVRGEVPCHKLYEDENTLVFLDIFPKNEGHTLVIPKQRPAEFLWDLDDDMYRSVLQTAKRVAVRLREVLPYQYVHMAVVGTDVPYAHVHLIPFDTTSQLHGKAPAEPDHTGLAALAERLRIV
ncbi:MAG: HIT domain-containing protein [Candidatus Saccharimonas sp.]